jgi:hypothetical protein
MEEDIRSALRYLNSNIEIELRLNYMLCSSVNISRLLGSKLIDRSKVLVSKYQNITYLNTNTVKIRQRIGDINESIRKSSIKVYDRTRTDYCRIVVSEESKIDIFDNWVKKDIHYAERFSIDINPSVRLDITLRNGINNKYKNSIELEILNGCYCNIAEIYRSIILVLGISTVDYVSLERYFVTDYVRESRLMPRDKLKDVKVIIRSRKGVRVLLYVYDNVIDCVDVLSKCFMDRLKIGCRFNYVVLDCDYVDGRYFVTDAIMDCDFNRRRKVCDDVSRESNGYVLVKDIIGSVKSYNKDEANDLILLDSIDKGYHETSQFEWRYVDTCYLHISNRLLNGYKFDPLDIPVEGVYEFSLCRKKETITLIDNVINRSYSDNDRDFANYIGCLKYLS